MNGQTRTKNILKFLVIIFSGIGLLALFVAGIFLIRNEAKITIENQSVVLADSSGTCGDNLTWTLDNNGVLTISGTGDMTSHPWYNISVKEVVIENGVTSIGDGAFNGCDSLISIVVDASNPNYSSADGILYNKDGTEIVCYPAGKSKKVFVISNSVTSIRHDAFFGCKNLTQVTIPNSVISIGSMSFHNCTNLKVVMKSIAAPSITEYTFGYIDINSVDHKVNKIMVPNEAVEIYNSATNWSNYVDIIEGYDPERQFTITFNNSDGIQLQEEQLYYYDLPVYNQTPPTKMATTEYIYNFDGWDKEIELATEDTTYTATYRQSGVPYIVTYNSNYGTEEELTQDVNYSEDFTTYGNSAFERNDYRIVSWNTERDGSGDEYPVDTEMAYSLTDNLTLYAQWEDEYTITYTLDGGEIATANPEAYTRLDEFTLNNPTKEGYTFLGWTGSNGVSPETTVTVTAGTTGNLNYTANWTAIDYYLTYDLNGGTGSITDANAYHITDVVTLTDTEPTKNGYDFNGWKYSNATVTQVTFGADDITVIADWTPTVYTISYTLDGGEVATANPTSYTIESDGFTLNNPSKSGYTFAGWTGSNGVNPETTVTIPAGTTGNLNYTANWTAIDYYLTYDLNGGSGSITDANAHHITDVVTLTDAEPTKSGYDFNGWKYNDETVTQVTFGADDITVVADWTPTVYTISYTLNNGSGTFKGNYTIEETFTLNVPTRTAYDFVGWTGSNGDEPEIEVTVEEGTTGDLSYTANWTPTVYDITYNLSGGSTDNPLTYTIEDATFTLSEPTREGYRFVGWTGSNGEEEQMVVTINHGTYGEKTYTAHWIVLAYSIRLTVDGVQSTQYYSIESGEITLENPTKDGYEFIGWTGSNGDEPELVVTIPTGNTENKAYTANWEVIEYTITYNLYGGSVATTNPESYTIEDEEIIITNPTKIGHEFIGWTGSNGDEAQLSVTIPAGSMGDKEYSANWEEISYTITMIIDGVSSTITYTPSSDDITLVNPEKNGYTFVGWTGSNGNEPELVVVILSGSSEDKEYVANWEIANYTITKIIDGVETTQTYTMFDSDIEIVNPTKDGYEFVGWTGSNGDEPELVVVISAGSYGDKTYTANWAQIYTITYNLDDGVFTTEYPENFTANSEDITLIAPSKRAYSFVGWTGSNGDEPELVVTIPAGSTGDKEYTAIWSPIEYTITYNLYGGTSTNPPTYTIEDDDIVLVVPTKDGCDFTGWTGNNGSTPQLSVTIPAGSTGNKEYTAHWVFMTYTITYTLDGGSASNIDSYTVESEGFTLNNPSKTGYTFLGWTGSNGDEPEREVTIPTGSIGNRSYIANFEPTVYTISYNLNGGSGENPASYTIESPKITLAKPTKNGYTFKGWTGSNGSVARETVTIASGSTGNKEYTANWTIVKYNLTYTLNGGTLSTSNPKTYTVEDEDIVLNNPSKTGYTFVGWTGANGDVPQTNTVISTGSTGAKSFVANFEIINYEIDYDLGGGSAENPDTYTILSDDFTLSNPTRCGYEFVGWTGLNGAIPELEITIASGSTGNKNFKANWELVTYTITVSIDEEENIKEYTIESDNIALVEPIREGYTFLGWTGSNGNVPQHDIVVETGNFGNKEYTANFEEIVYKITLIIGDEQEIQNYTINSETITLEEPIRDGYRFVGWTGSNGTAPEMVVQIEKGNIGGKVYFANFELINYVIIMTIDGHPYEINYSVESEDIKLSNPVKEGYTFLGWSASDDPEIKEEVIISNGNFGNKEYIANWSLNQYTIKLHMDNEVKTSNYNILTPTQTIAKPSKKGYKFTGWLGANLTEKTVDLVIEQGSTGDREYFATWEELPKSTIGLIVGPVIGGVIFIAGVVVLILLLIKKKESKITK